MKAPVDDIRKGRPSASKMDTVAHCPGCLQAEADYSEEEPDEQEDYTTDGDMIHAALETEDFSELTETQEEIAERCKNMIEIARRDWAQINGFKDEDIAVHKEERFWLTSGDEDVVSAQVDIAFVCGTKALVIDAKTGYAEVTPSHRNRQIRTQAVCLFCEMPFLTEITGAIAAFRFRERFSSTTYDRKKLVMATKEVNFLLWRANDPDAERVPGPWCGYCKAKGNCAECSTRAMLPTVLLRDVVGKPTEDDIRAAIHQLTPEQLVYLHRRGSLAVKLFTAVRNRIRNLDEPTLTRIGLAVKPQTMKIAKSVGSILKHLISLQWLKKEEAAEVCKLLTKKLTDTATGNMQAMDPDTFRTQKSCVEAITREINPWMEEVPKASRIVDLPKPKAAKKKKAK